MKSGQSWKTRKWRNPDLRIFADICEFLLIFAFFLAHKIGRFFCFFLNSCEIVDLHFPGFSLGRLGPIQNQSLYQGIAVANFLLWGGEWHHHCILQVKVLLSQVTCVSRIELRYRWMEYVLHISVDHNRSWWHFLGQMLNHAFKTKLWLNNPRIELLADLANLNSFQEKWTVSRKTRLKFK